MARRGPSAQGGAVSVPVRASGPAISERAWISTRHVLEEVGDMMILTGKTIWSALRPPYPYGGELVSQFLFTLRLVWFPLLITTVAISYGAPGLQAGDFLTLFGALDRLGGFFVLASIREIGPLITSIVMAGVAGTAITAGPRGRQGGGGGHAPPGAGGGPGQKPGRPRLL